MALNSVVVKQHQAQRVQEELVVLTAAITPGMLVEVSSTSGKVIKHNSAGQNVIPPKFCLEDELQGSDIDTNIAVASPAQIWTPQRGDWVYAILADGESVAIGDPLESGGDGTLKKHVADTADSDDSFTSYPNQIVGIAREALDLSDSSGGESSGALGYNKRLIIEIV